MDQQTRADDACEWSLPDIFAGIPAAAVMVAGGDVGTAVVAGVSPPLAEILGQPVPTGIGLDEFDEICRVYQPDHVTRATCTRRFIARAIEHGESNPGEEIHILRPNGEWRVLLAQAAPLRHDGRVGGVVLGFEDLTEARRADRILHHRLGQLQDIQKLTDTVNRAGDIDTIYDGALDALQQGVGCSRAAVLLFDPDEVMRFKAWRGLSDAYRAAAEGHTPWQRNTVDPQPVLVADVERDAELAALLPVFHAEGIGALAFIPLLHEGRLVGKFMLYYDAPHRFQPGEVELARIIAGHVALALHRKQAEDALRESEQRYRMLMEEAADAISVTDGQGNIVEVSTRGTELVGYTREELLRMNIAELVPPEDLKRDPLQFSRLESGETLVRERRLRRKDGSIFPVEYSARRLGRGLFQGIVRDITKRKRAEASLRFLAEAGSVLNASLDYAETLERLARLVVPILGDWCIMYVINEDRSVRRSAVVHADPTKADLARRLMECPPPVFDRARPELEALRTGRPQFLPSVPESLLRALATGGPGHLEVLHELEATAAMVVPFWGRDRLLGVAHFFLTEPGRRYEPEDLALAEETARRAAVAVENARLYQEARRANEAKDEFLAVLSHELRNPLASILAGIDVLRRSGIEDERARRALEIVARNSQLQARLINDLLDLSRIDRGKIRLQRAPIELADVVQAAVQGAIRDAEDAGLELAVTAEPAVWVQGDLDRLQQVVMNLLSNAIKFTPPPGRVSVSVRRDPCARGPAAVGNGGDRHECGSIVVEDTGIGISRELLPRLFNMFQQGEVGGQRKPGLGIGLALVKSITERHGGHVWAESDGPGRGSRFTVELPLVPAPARAGEDAPERADGGDLLLVEDNPDTRSILTESLELEGYRVRGAESGEEALEGLRSHRPDAILADIGLPGMNGYEFLCKARELPGLAEVPAFAVTGYGQDEDVARARHAGYAGHFVKPVDVPVLAQRLREWLGARKAAS